MLVVEDVIFRLRGAVHGQAFGVRLKARDSLGEVFGEEELARVGDVAAGIFLGGSASDVGLDVDVDGATGVPAGVDGGEFGAALLIG